MKAVEEIIEGIRSGGYGSAFPGRGGGESPIRSRDPFHVLIATVLSQRTKDANTHAAVTRLFARYDSPRSIADAPIDELKELIRPAGFPNAKARSIKEISRIILEDHGGEVPRRMEALLSLPMVGRKTANCVRAYAFQEDAICVDTHVHRISNRIGLVSTKHPDETEAALRNVVPKPLWREINTLMVTFGQKVCRPRNPRCEECPINRHCDEYLGRR